MADRQMEGVLSTCILGIGVHLLTCETRLAVRNGTTARDLRLRTLMPSSSSFIVAELCESKVWPKRDFGMMKASAVADYARHAPPADLLIFTDSDVLFNGVATPGEFVRRFDAARGSSRIVFMAEPWCFAPTMETVTRHNGLRRVEATSCTERKLSQYEQRGPSHAQRPWHCPRFLNSGAYAGLASEVAKLGELWADATLWRRGCKPRPNWGFDDQCIAMEIMLLGNVSIALDTHEALFASGGTAVARSSHRFSRRQKLMANSTRCAACGRTACDCSLLNEWRFPDSRRPNVPSDGRVAIVPLQRTAHYLSSCAIAEVNPLVVHFNGVSKRLMKTTEMQAWLEAFSTPANESLEDEQG